MLSQFVNIIKLLQCLNGRTFDSVHNCYGVRKKKLEFERYHLMVNFLSTRDSLLQMIVNQPLLHDLFNLLYIQLLNHGHTAAEISAYNFGKENVLNTACSTEMLCTIFHAIWNKHLDPVGLTVYKV